MRGSLAHEAAAVQARLDAALDDARHTRDEAVAALSARLAELHLPHVPTIEELREAARQRYAATPSLDVIVARARERLLEAVARELLAPQPA